MWPWSLMPTWALSRKDVSRVPCKHGGSSAWQLQLPFKLLNGLRTPEQVTLKVVAATRSQRNKLLPGLHPFSQYRQAHALSQHDDHLRDLGTIAIQQHALHKTLIDLQLIQRQPGQVVQ